LMEVTKTRTKPYRPSSGGQVERYDQMVLSFIRCYLGDKMSRWDEHLATLSILHTRLGITGTALALFRSYLTNRKQSVLIRGTSLGQPSRGSDRASPTGSSQSSFWGRYWDTPLVVQIVPHQQEAVSPHPERHHWDSPLVVEIVPHQQEAVSPHPAGIIHLPVSGFGS
ncbi:hypothetical protein LSAT2_019948, partial [Lamellibrachia satsuma]